METSYCWVDHVGSDIIIKLIMSAVTSSLRLIKLLTTAVNKKSKLDLGSWLESTRRPYMELSPYGAVYK